MFPLDLEAKLVAGAIAALALAGAVWFVVDDLEARGARREKDAVAATAAAAAASAAATEARWQASTQETVHDAQVKLAAASAAAASADRQRGALLVQLAQLRRRGVPQDPAATRRGPDLEGSDPIGVLADVLGRSDARASIVDDLADRRRIRAEACERAWDALTP